MLIVAQHTVLDPKFWEIAATAPIPGDLALLQVAPSADGTRGVCLWEAESIERLREFIEPAVGNISRNEFFAVAAERGIGLPTTRTPAHA